MPPPDRARSGVETLNAQVDNAILIVKQLNSNVQEIYKNADKVCTGRKQFRAPPDTLTSWDPPSSIDALALAGDAATLIRAHATKVSLLMLNEPFTPSAIGKVVQQLMNEPVPALANSVQECHGDRYTYWVQRETALRGQRVLGQVEALFASIPRDGKALPSGNSQGKSNRGAFTDIGILWNECDTIAALAKDGVRGHVTGIVNQLGETLKDELEELKEWGDEESDEEDEEDEEDEDGGTEETQETFQHAATQAMLDELMDAGHHIPAADPDHLRPRLEATLQKLRMTRLLCTALVKRRIAVLPAMPTAKPSSMAARLDNMLMVLQGIPDRFGELAAAFYELNVSGVDACMEHCFEDAYLAAETLALSWVGEQDEFSRWVGKFQKEMRQALNIPP